MRLAPAQEHRLRGDALFRFTAEAGNGDVAAIGEALPADGEGGRRGFVEFGERQRDGLIPAVLHGLLQAERGEAGRDEAGGNVIAARPGVAPFQQVVGQEYDVGPDRIGRKRRFLRQRGGGEGKQGSEDGQAAEHG